MAAFSAYERYFHMANDIPAGIRIIRGANRTLGRVAPSLASRLSRRIFSTPRKFAPREWEVPFETMARRERLLSGLWCCAPATAHQ